MKVLVGIARIFVGIFFIISGFIKMNDPVGFSYKLQEYFGEDVLNLPFLQPFALGIAVFVVIYELLLGVMLILGYRKKFTMWSLLLMIVFFTFLTFYSAYFNKVTDCGCFGDALPLTPWQSFWKDVVLLVLILLIFIKGKFFKPLFEPATSHKWIVFLVFIACLGFTYHVLMHLPAIDFRAYKEGTVIREGMKPKKGEVIPPIHDFGFYSREGDATEEILNADKVLLVVAYNLSKSENQGWSNIKIAVKKAQEKGYRVVGLSASGPQETNQVKETYGFDFPFYFTDETAIKTIVRSNPGLVTIEKGVIIQKVHYNDADDLELK
ncbi:Uncharacterized membrane protein YphA, DoxX/SURF4 family [Mesonia phycicola]|uniref:Uncharacterized membrane protein YphA, DoxX/SURF4 family n=1 Tax=Mesonia phycicola TaxID=579105 RepID=A0A1M6G5D6_9FLAO|nr:BT_3928 family protein [Mesonia phycicola]SHJ05218.1 Uncharacterized membrane protein YphA, DoxX/SURF4 family [Mesonia phycicola]